MRLLTAFLRFWYDFVVGDAWDIAAGIVVVLGLGALLASRQALPSEGLALAVGAGIVLVVGASLLLEARRHGRTSPLDVDAQGRSAGVAS